MGEITAVVSAKGGTGRTTFTANLGLALSKRGIRTLIVDMNFMSNDLSALFGEKDRVVYHMLDVIEGKCRIIQAMIPDGSNVHLHLLPASSVRPLSQIPKQSFLKLMDMLKQSFDLILLDVPAGRGIGLEYALASSDAAVVLTTPDALSLNATHSYLEIPGFESVRKCFVINRFRRNLIGDGYFRTPEETAEEMRILLLGILPESEEILLSAESFELIRDEHTSAGRCFDNIAGRLLGDNIPINLRQLKG